jgi:type I restriction enzyme, S subunit
MMHDLFTRGLDEDGRLRPSFADAPDLYKDSGLDWIPRSWEECRVGDVLKERPKNGYSPRESQEWTGTVMLGLGCLTPTGFLPTQIKNAPPDDPRVDAALLADGDLLMSRSNTRDLVGMVGRYRDFGIPCVYPDLMMRLRPLEGVFPGFLEEMLRHSRVRRQLVNAASGTSGSMVKINATIVMNTRMVLPPAREQKEIMRRVTSLKKLGEQERNLLGKLNIIRTGLMQDLLTGKVRVNLDEPEHAVAPA